MPDTTIDRSVFLSSQTVEWPTPQWLYDELNKEFGFTVDVAADPTNTKCPKFYTVDDDGISQDWDGEVVWCNPPYGDQLKHWVWKAAHAAATTVMLVPARTDVKWFHDYVLPLAEIRFIKGRLKFGNATTPAPFPTMLCIWRNSEGAPRHNI
jgi:site-specific DNA-methyltransferase (adenine-specific)